MDHERLPVRYRNRDPARDPLVEARDRNRDGRPEPHNDGHGPLEARDPRIAALHLRARGRGVNPLVYWIVRALLQTFFLTYLRMRRIGREHIPAKGPVIVAAIHRSFLDPFVIATMAKRPMYYMAKEEIFQYHPVLAWILGALGAFPVARGASDEESVKTSKAIL